MKLLEQGAEAKVFLSKYMGRKCIVKVREPKKYREQELDENIRTQRFRTECTLLLRAKKAGVRTPSVWKIDLQKNEITTEFIDGKRLKEILMKDKKNASALCSKIGKDIAKLHAHAIVHGDLTTSNILLHKKKLVFLDFGLGVFSQKIEDKAVDLLSLKKTFLSTHFSIAHLWKKIENTYAKSSPEGKNIILQIAKIEARARYY
ncbi:MAG TPA: KEOPS complex kinase/ATPase Bud32 [archaeon]|nr:KEOPS complex kinase/ATPase Bud32 [archaeon]